jgi:hypothetical protein
MQPDHDPVLTRGRWSLKRAAVYGLILQAVAFIVSNLADGGADLAVWLQGRPAQYVTYILAQFLPAPVIFVAVAAVRTCLFGVLRSLRKLRRPIFPNAASSARPSIASARPKRFRR